MSKKHLIRFIVMLGLVILCQIISYQSAWIENNYSNGIYPAFSKALRFIFGVFPFSLGDLLYGLIGVYLLYSIFSSIFHRNKVKKENTSFITRVLKKLNFLLLCYLFFSLNWGFNYYRQGIAKQLKLSKLEYDTADLRKLNEKIGRAHV